MNLDEGCYSVLIFSISIEEVFLWHLLEVCKILCRKTVQSWPSKAYILSEKTRLLGIKERSCKLEG